MDNGVREETVAADNAATSDSTSEPGSTAVPRSGRGRSGVRNRRKSGAQKVSAADSGRLASRMRRKALSKHGKNGADACSGGMNSAQMLKQKNPEMSCRDVARSVRALRSSQGGRAEAKPSAPSGRQRPGRRQRNATGTKIHHSEHTTGDEYGLCRDVTGTEYFSSEVFDQFCQGEPPRAPRMVETTSTLAGHGVTSAGTVARSEKVTGDERGFCNNVTGTEYVGRESYDDFCPSRPEPGSAKVSFSQTSRGQVVSGSKPARAEGVTGNETGTCAAVTGTPYAGLEQFSKYCPDDRVNSAMARAPRPARTVDSPSEDVTGNWPRATGMTGMERGACANVSGTGYSSLAETRTVCAAQPADVAEPDFPQRLEVTGGEPTPRAAQPAAAGQATAGRVTGGASTTMTSRISGTFSMGQGKVTGTEDFRSGNAGGSAAGVAVPMPEVVAEPWHVTGEGITTGLKITGDDWDRGDRVTGTEGTSAARRNMTRRGPVNAMPEVDRKRNEEVPPADQIVTGSSGGTEKGAMITVSGGARG